MKKYIYVQCDNTGNGPCCHIYLIQRSKYCTVSSGHLIAFMASMKKDCNVKKVIVFPVPSRYVANQTLPGQELLNYSRIGNLFNSVEIDTCSIYLQCTRYTTCFCSYRCSELVNEADRRCGDLIGAAVERYNSLIGDALKEVRSSFL